MSLVSRPYYLDFLRRHKDRPIIKVVSGIRRCGKSTLFKLFQDELLADNVTAEQIIDINFELMEYDKLRDYRALYEYINKRIIPSKKMYLFLDEIQHVPSFERVVDNFFVQDNIDIYILQVLMLILCPLIWLHFSQVAMYKLRCFPCLIRNMLMPIVKVGFHGWSYMKNM